jgi:hypothetical protein
LQSLYLIPNLNYLRPPDWHSCLQSAAVSNPTAANISAAATDVVDHDAPVASAVAVDSAVIAGVGVV